jgi:NAD(P)-dependent dehydrogenase (short-subunit alcohol dehydrogenase family)
MELKGKTIIVTGASGALGRAVVAALDARGADCRPLSLREGPGEEEVAAFYRDLPEVWASVHVAGGFSMAPIAETSLRDWEGIMETNARTAFLCSREAVRAMRRGGGGGRIVNVAAIPAIEPRKGAGMVAYAMSKAAVAALTVALAEEVAAEGIWVNAVVPSILDTKANREAMPEADPARWAKVEEVAETIAFLVSPKNAVVRGALVPVNGRS